MITFDEIISDADRVSTNVPKNNTSIVLTNFHSKKVRHKRDCYILHTALPVIVLLFLSVTICYHYAKHGSELKNLLPCSQYKNGE